MRDAQRRIKQTVRVGTASMVGKMALGSVGNIGGASTAPVFSSASAGLDMVGIGQMTKNATAIFPRGRGRKRW